MNNSVKKLIRYKGLIALFLIIYISFLNLFLIGVPLSLLGDLINELYVKIIFIILLLIINFFAMFFFGKWLYKKLNVYIYIHKESINFKDYKKDVFIPISQIKSLNYERNKNGGFELKIYLFDNSFERLFISKTLSKKIAKIINKELIIETLPLKTRLKNWLMMTYKDFISFIKKNKLKIIFTIIGSILTIASIILYELFKSIIFLTIVLCIVNLIFGFFQLYYLYFKEKMFSKFERVLLTSLTSFFFVLIVFMIILIIGVINKQPISIDYLVYAVMLLPSFVVVIAIVTLLIMALGYM